ncbi:hypothetical protein [Metabacillus idriensis]|uniref:hypothetical protein n=1 Tax=Metabacillus idriensis TaxID=324768 RepID=UPI001749984D|nr:hypothetical protein [Metabacillus idriensis]
MELVSTYLLNELKVKKEAIEKLILDTYKSTTDDKFIDYNQSNQLNSIFSSKEIQENIIITLEHVNRYLNEKKYDEIIQQNLSVKLDKITSLLNS